VLTCCSRSSPKRYEHGSTIITTNIAFKDWPRIFAGDATMTSALLDRLLHHAQTVLISKAIATAALPTDACQFPCSRWSVHETDLFLTRFFEFPQRLNRFSAPLLPNTLIPKRRLFCGRSRRQRQVLPGVSVHRNREQLFRRYLTGRFAISFRGALSGAPCLVAYCMWSPASAFTAHRVTQPYITPPPRLSRTNRSYFLRTRS
jgi:IstB-like ATP binding protein